MTLLEFARERAGALLDRLEKQLGRAAEGQDADAIHDLRVSIRRLMQTLRSLGPVFGDATAKAIRSELREVMRLAGEIRSRDIALELFAKAGVESSSPAAVRFTKEREMARRRMLKVIGEWERRKVCGRWREALAAKVTV